MRFWIGPYRHKLVRSVSFSLWAKGAVAAIDLRSIPQRSVPFSGFGFFVSNDDVVLSSEYTFLGRGSSVIDLMVPAQARLLYESALGLTA
jgi:hypothetical protein